MKLKFKTSKFQSIFQFGKCNFPPISSKLMTLIRFLKIAPNATGEKMEIQLCGNERDIAPILSGCDDNLSEEFQEES